MKIAYIAAFTLYSLGLAFPVSAEEPTKGKLASLKDKLLKIVDKNGDGKLDDSDKEKLFNDLKKQALEKYDADKDGKLSPEEKSKAKADLQGAADKTKGTGKTGDSSLLKRFDKDKDGKLSDSEKEDAKAAMDKLLGSKKKKPEDTAGTEKSPKKSDK